MKKIFISFIILLVCFSLIPAQELRINGKVLDRNTHQSISYVNIYLKGTAIGTTTDFAGRFSLNIPRTDPKMIIVFQHINYDRQEIPLDQLKLQQRIYMQPRVIPLPEIEIEATGEKSAMAKDLPQAISMIKSDNFEIRGYVDAGDLLRTDQSIQVEEELSGKKIISIRGGNADDVVVLYNGIKMNSEYDNIFDFSFIDLEDIERFELIKGSNTVLFGSEAFSGVINIVPKAQQDYNIRLQQRVGTYDSGNWGLHLYQNYKNLNGSYRFRQGGARRKFSDAVDDSQLLENTASHHTGTIEYSFSKGPGGVPKNTLGAIYLQSKLDYQNQRDVESLTNSSKLIGLRYEGNIYKLNNLTLSLSQRWFDEKLSLVNQLAGMDRQLDEQSLNVQAEKSLRIKSLDLLFAYQFENTELDLFDQRTNPVRQNRAIIQRDQHGLISILKLHAPSGSTVLKTVDFDLSYRYDYVSDAFDNLMLSSLSQAEMKGNQWQESLVKFAANFSGYHQNYAFNIFMNIGTNIKFPTLLQLISSKQTAIMPVGLNPEKNKSLEMAITLKRDIREHPVVYGWQISGNYLNNHFDNKFRPYYSMGIPFVLYDNVPDAKISGVETKSTIFFFKKKVTLELGLSKYSISDRAAFPFKYDMKQTVNFILDHAGYGFQFLWFDEGEQTGWVRLASGRLAQVILPKFSNIDIHLSKTFTISRLNLFGNMSIRNLLSDKFELEGIALRDRRYYLTVGVQY